MSANKKENDQAIEKHQRGNNEKPKNIKKDGKSSDSSTESHVQNQDRRNKSNQDQEESLHVQDKKEEPRRNQSKINRMRT